MYRTPDEMRTYVRYGRGDGDGRLITNPYSCRQWPNWSTWDQRNLNSSPPDVICWLGLACVLWSCLAAGCNRFALATAGGGRYRCKQAKDYVHGGAGGGHVG